MIHLLTLGSGIFPKPLRGIVFAKIDTEDQSVIAKHYGVISVPTVMIMRDGIIVINHEGTLTEAAIYELITHVRCLDMDKVREDLDKDEE